jgi:hypothetical protein
MPVGPIARIAPNTLVTSEVELLRRMSAARSPYTRADWYDGLRLDPKINSVISERNDKLHNALRAKISVGVSVILIKQSTSLTSHAVLWKGFTWIGAVY